ncbi:Outer membrane protein TolC [Catalinimonas alkaloidigena]|uniref:Outer membrane protein TolC n=1 Tax=Catalinimonas alkaloidigena TaxID=1075417 RepID=A0A1G9A3Y3_9BACT|nr:TolC family protein [Catalinimonas alkaloidigena]SDK22038.1 Outer membrane protein TolC [Catalinimonas alkaloidigena]
MKLIRRRPLFLAALLGLLGPASVWAQTSGAPAYSIRECIEYAQQNNHRLKVARLDQEIAQQQVNETRSRGLPQANINGSFEDKLKVPLLVIPGFSGGLGADSTSGGDTQRGIPMGYQYNTSLSGEVTQMVFDPSFWVGLKAAKASEQYYQQNSQQSQEQTAYDVANAYYQVIVVQKQLDLLRTNLASTQKTLETTQLQFENGLAKQVDVNRLRVNANTLQSRIQQTELNLAQAYNLLKFQMGMELSEPITLSDTTLELRNEPALTEAVDNYYQNRVDFRLLQTNLELQQLDTRNRAVGYSPTLTGFANYGYVAQGADFGLFPTSNNNWLDYTTASIGLRLRIPVFDGFARRSQIQQSKLKVQQLEENLALTKQNISLEVSNAETQYRNTRQRIESEQENIDLAKQVYEVTQLEFREGVGTSTDVVEAETSLREAQNTYITTLLDLYVARLDLERAKGNILPYLTTK